MTAFDRLVRAGFPTPVARALAAAGYDVAFVRADLLLLAAG